MVFIPSTVRSYTLSSGYLTSPQRSEVEAAAREVRGYGYLTSSIISRYDPYLDQLTFTIAFAKTSSELANLKASYEERYRPAEKVMVAAIEEARQAVEAGDVVSAQEKIIEAKEAARQVESTAVSEVTRQLARTVQEQATEGEIAASTGDLPTLKAKTAEMAKAATALAAPKWGLTAIVIIGLLLFAGTRKKK